MLEHGGDLTRASREYGIPEERWLDLSTGINPMGYPVPPVPPSVWQRLPGDAEPLLCAAREYYQAVELLPVAGTQAAIQALPRLRPRSRALSTGRRRPTGSRRSVAVSSRRAATASRP